MERPCLESNNYVIGWCIVWAVRTLIQTEYLSDNTEGSRRQNVEARLWSAHKQNSVRSLQPYHFA